MLNQCNFIGNLGKDPEIRVMPNGKKVANFSIAITEKYKKQSGEVVETTEWTDLTAFDSLAGIVEQYVKKGSKVFITAKKKTQTWDSPEGVKKYKVVFNVEKMIMLDSKKSENSGNNPGYSAPANTDYPDSQGQDDLPF